MQNYPVGKQAYLHHTHGVNKTELHIWSNFKKFL